MGVFSWEFFYGIKNNTIGIKIYKKTIWVDSAKNGIPIMRSSPANSHCESYASISVCSSRGNSGLYLAFVMGINSFSKWVKRVWKFKINGLLISPNFSGLFHSNLFIQLLGVITISEEFALVYRWHHTLYDLPRSGKPKDFIIASHTSDTINYQH